MNKNKKKNILWLGLALVPISLVLPLTITSCKSSNNSNNQNSVVPYIQPEYQKNMDLYLSDNKGYVFQNNGVLRQYASFQDEDTNSPTYKGWYLLLRDGNNNNELIASFCGWNGNYLDKKDVYDKINAQGYSIPSSISLPTNSSLTGWNKSQKIPVKAIGYDEDMLNYREIALANSDTLENFAKDKLFYDDDFTSVDLPITPCISNLDLSLNPIKYIFNNGISSSWYIRSENVNLIFPESLIYLGSSDILDTSGMFTKNVLYDFSKTKLVEIQKLTCYGSGLSKIILPETCKRISKINCYDGSYSGRCLEINLENVLYYGKDAMWACNFKDKKVVINKEAQYFDGTGYDSFRNNVELVDKEGNVLRPAISSN